MTFAPDFPIPDRIARLPRDARGYPVPAFVAFIDGVPDFRVVLPQFLWRAYTQRLCWICGDKLGRHQTYVIGPMCVVNRTSSELPSHSDCAEFAVRACPFLSNPEAKRREHGLPENTTDPGGIMLKRNPGVTVLWTSRDRPRPFRAPHGVLLELPDPTMLQFWREGRRATREEVYDSLRSGLPALSAIAQQQSNEAVQALRAAIDAALVLIDRHFPDAAANPIPLTVPEP